MKKQDFLDQTATSNEMAATQEMLRLLNKTQVQNAARMFHMLNTILYKTDYKNLSFISIYECLLAVNMIYKSETDGTKNNLESA